MKKPPVRNCDECRHFAASNYDGVKGVCRLGHKLRFVMPNATLRSLEGGRWGWRRACEDYEAKEMEK